MFQVQFLSELSECSTLRRGLDLTLPLRHQFRLGSADVPVLPLSTALAVDEGLPRQRQQAEAS